MTTIYEAVMRAADHIERNPREFDFHSPALPMAPGCGTPGCALGWIGYFGSVRGYGGCGDRVPLYLGLSEESHPQYAGGRFKHPTFAFYNRMDAVFGSNEWINSATACARAMRLYAAKYLQPAKPEQQAPDWQAMAERLAASHEYPKGAISVLNPQGTEETGKDRPVAPSFTAPPA